MGDGCWGRGAGCEGMRWRGGRGQGPSRCDHILRVRRAEQEAHAAKLKDIMERFDAHSFDTRASMQALDTDLGSVSKWLQTGQNHDSRSGALSECGFAWQVRAHCEQQLTVHGNSIEVHKSKLLQCGQAVEKLWSSSKLQQQRIDSLGSSGALQGQQLQERQDRSSHTRP
jgi:hypothetical protein